MKKLYVGITDSKWLKNIKNVYHNTDINNVVNFWKISNKEFKSIEPGELFLFKLHNNKNKGSNGEIVGGGIFSHYEKMSLQNAWDCYKEGNGASSYEEMGHSIVAIQKRFNIDNNIEIGCIIIRNIFFLDEWISEPRDWSKSIVSGKSYKIDSGVGYEINNLVSQQINNMMNERLQNSELRRNITEKIFEKAFTLFIEQANKNQSSEKANGTMVPYGFKNIPTFDGEKFKVQYGQGRASKTPYMNWWVVSIYYIPKSGDIILGIEIERFKHWKAISLKPLGLQKIGGRSNNVAIYYSTNKNKLNIIELYHNFINLCDKVIKYRDGAIHFIEKIEFDLEESHLIGREKEVIVKARINQSIFRQLIIERYAHCCICSVENPALLIASHIKPWVACNPDEKLDVENGLLLCSNHDKLFDKGLITIENDGKICVSNLLSQSDLNKLNLNDKLNISLTEQNKKYLEYHRNNIFNI